MKTRHVRICGMAHMCVPFSFFEYSGCINRVNALTLKNWYQIEHGIFRGKCTMVGLVFQLW